MATDFAKAREMMVDCQIRTADVTQAALLTAFAEVPRELFVPADKKALAYLDAPVPLENGRFLLPPAALARLLQAADIQRDDIVLDIGCATGYSAAVLSRLCASVVAVESARELVETASATLAELECDNAVVVEGKLTEGYASEGPFNVIFLGGAIGELPEALLHQLKDNGRLVAVEGTGNAAMARMWHNDRGVFSMVPMFNCAVPPLPGFARKAEFVF